MAIEEKLTREEAINVLTTKRDMAEDAQTVAEFKLQLELAGNAVGYAPAFRCLVMGMEPEDSVRWGK